MICTACTLGMVAIAPNAGFFSRHRARRRFSGLLRLHPHLAVRPESFKASA